MTGTMLNQQLWRQYWLKYDRVFIPVSNKEVILSEIITFQNLCGLKSNFPTALCMLVQVKMTS